MAKSKPAKVAATEPLKSPANSTPALSAASAMPPSLATPFATIPEAAAADDEQAEMQRQMYQICDRLEQLLANAAIVLPKPRFDEERTISKLLADANSAPLRMTISILLRIEPLIRFCEQELIPALAESSSNLEAIVSRAQLDRDAPDGKPNG